MKLVLASLFLIACADPDPGGNAGDGQELVAHLTTLGDFDQLSLQIPNAAAQDVYTGAPVRAFDYDHVYVAGPDTVIFTALRNGQAFASGGAAAIKYVDARAEFSVLLQ